MLVVDDVAVSATALSWEHWGLASERSLAAISFHVHSSPLVTKRREESKTKQGRRERKENGKKTETREKRRSSSNSSLPESSTDCSFASLFPLVPSLLGWVVRQSHHAAVHWPSIRAGLASRPENEEKMKDKVEWAERGGKKQGGKRRSPHRFIEEYLNKPEERKSGTYKDAGREGETKRRKYQYRQHHKSGQTTSSYPFQVPGVIMDSRIWFLAALLLLACIHEETGLPSIRLALRWVSVL